MIMSVQRDESRVGDAMASIVDRGEARHASIFLPEDLWPISAHGPRFRLRAGGLMLWLQAPEFDFTRSILRKGCVTAIKHR
jgi:hypothetical protein